MDVFTTVVGIVIAGIALFIGYRVGVKDGFRGGFQSGRTLERQVAVDQRRLLAARTVREGAVLLPVLEQKVLSARSLSATQGAARAEEHELVSRVSSAETGMQFDPNEGNQF